MKARENFRSMLQRGLLVTLMLLGNAIFADDKAANWDSLSEKQKRTFRKKNNPARKSSAKATASVRMF